MKSNNLSQITDILASMPEYQILIKQLNKKSFDISAQLKGEIPIEEPRRFWQWNFYYPSIATNAAVREGHWKLVRPMISGTRFYANKELYVSEEEADKAAAFIEADIKHKENPLSITDILPVPRMKSLSPEEPELFNLAVDPSEQNDLAKKHPDRVRKMLNELETWFERVETDRRSIDEPLHSVF